jgi:hypothetical protein
MAPNVSSMPVSFSRDDVRDFLERHGYTSNPKRLAQPFPVAFISESKGMAYLDVNAEAVRKGNEVPDRPVRITFHKVFDYPMPSVETVPLQNIPLGPMTTHSNSDAGGDRKSESR